MLRSSVVLLVVAAVTLACGGATESSSSSSSGSSSGHVCTDIGCQNGFQLDFSYRERGAYVFDLEVDGVAVVCKASLPLLSVAVPACTADVAQLGLVGSRLPESQQSIGGLLFATSPRRVKIRVQRDAKVLVETTLEPVYTVTPGPNGPDCDPKECKSAKASLP